jgi:hypothetical protein
MHVQRPLRLKSFCASKLSDITIYFVAEAAALLKSQWNEGAGNSVFDYGFAIRVNVLCPPKVRVWQPWKGKAPVF